MSHRSFFVQVFVAFPRFLSPHSVILSRCFLGGRAFGPPLCGGTPPATPPSKTSAHRHWVVFSAVRPDQRGGCQPNTQSDNLNGGGVERLVETDAVCGLGSYGSKCKRGYKRVGGVQPSGSLRSAKSTIPNKRMRPGLRIASRLPSSSIFGATTQPFGRLHRGRLPINRNVVQPKATAR